MFWRRRKKQNERERCETSIRRFAKKNYARYLVDEEELVIFMLLLAETGLVPPWKMMNSSYLERRFCPFSASSFDCPGVIHLQDMKENRKITKLSLGHDFAQPISAHTWEFHNKNVYELLEKLDALENLVLKNCSSFRLCETVYRLPKLKQLMVMKCETIVLRPQKEDLLVRQEFAPELESLYLMNYCMESEEELAVFLFDVLPVVSKLTTFSIQSNKVKSFQGIAKQLLASKTATAGRLRKLYLGSYKCDTPRDDYIVRQSLHCRIVPEARDESQRQEERMEVEAVKTFLVAYRELQNFIRHNTWFFSYYRGWNLRPALKHQIAINHAGRVLVERRKNAKPLPLSVWPIVLARAWKFTADETTPHYTKTSANGVYYLLRNVEALQTVNQRTPEGTNTQSKIRSDHSVG